MNFSCFNNPKPDIFYISKISKARPSIATVRGQILGTDSTKNTNRWWFWITWYILLYVHPYYLGYVGKMKKILKPIVFQIELNPPPSFCTEFTGWKEWNPSIQRDLSGMIE